MPAQRNSIDESQGFVHKNFHFNHMQGVIVRDSEQYLPFLLVLSDSMLMFQGVFTQEPHPQ
jgi:hypothetical protein